MFSGIAFFLSGHNHFSSKQRWMAWLLFWKIFVHHSSPWCECFAEDIVFMSFFSSWKVQSLGSRCWCRVWRFCRRERVMVPYSVQDKGTRLIIELYIAFFSPLSILNDTMWGVNGKNMTAGWENHQPPNPVPKRTNNRPSQEKEVKNRDWHKTWSLQQDPNELLLCLSFVPSVVLHEFVFSCPNRATPLCEQNKKTQFFSCMFCNVWAEQKNLLFFPACSAIPQQIQTHGISGEKQEFYQCSYCHKFPLLFRFNFLKPISNQNQILSRVFRQVKNDFALKVKESDFGQSSNPSS
jgi:hypothetical protein